MKWKIFYRSQSFWQSFVSSETHYTHYRPNKHVLIACWKCLKFSTKMPFIIMPDSTFSRSQYTCYGLNNLSSRGQDFWAQKNSRIILDVYASNQFHVHKLNTVRISELELISKNMLDAKMRGVKAMLCSLFTHEANI